MRSKLCALGGSALFFASFVPAHASIPPHALDSPITVSTPGIQPVGPENAVTAANPFPHRHAAQVLVGLINAERARHSLHSLTLSPYQSKCSLKHTKQMVAENELTHQGFPADVCAHHTEAGENAGVWSGNPKTALPAMEQAMIAEGPCPTKPCSEHDFHIHGHYVNLLNPSFTKVGIGIVVRQGVTWLTEDFTN